MKNRAKDRHHQLLISFITHQGLLISPLLSLALAHYANEPLHKTLPMNCNEDGILNLCTCVCTCVCACASVCVYRTCKRSVSACVNTCLRVLGACLLARRLAVNMHSFHRQLMSLNTALRLLIRLQS